jgi:hypothetical protein
MSLVVFVIALAPAINGLLAGRSAGYGARAHSLRAGASLLWRIRPLRVATIWAPGSSSTRFWAEAQLCTSCSPPPLPSF